MHAYGAFLPTSGDTPAPPARSIHARLWHLCRIALYAISLVAFVLISGSHYHRHRHYRPKVRNFPEDDA
jgi:hypothetical protein